MKSLKKSETENLTSYLGSFLTRSHAPRSEPKIDTLYDPPRLSSFWGPTIVPKWRHREGTHHPVLKCPQKWEVIRWAIGHASGKLGPLAWSMAKWCKCPQVTNIGPLASKQLKMPERTKPFCHDQQLRLILLWEWTQLYTGSSMCKSSPHTQPERSHTHLLRLVCGTGWISYHFEFPISYTG